MTGGRVLYRTWSVCPVCLERLPARRVQIGREVFLDKTCARHGTFRTVIWRGYSAIGAWIAPEPPLPDNPRCPSGCGLCPDHLRKTCCVILNVTARCNLDCRFCFSDHGTATHDPPLEELQQSLSCLIEKSKTLVQLSGGEPTVRDDLPEIIRAAKDTGAKYVQLNTNGIRLSGNPEYVRQLADAGLSFVFMQFDGTDDAVYRQLRGRPLLEIKKRAIRTCSEFNIGVTLVPTLVRGINDRNIGDILQFAVSQSPAVRGVHFQPVSYFGRMPKLPDDSDRITLDELMHEIGNQTGGMFREINLLPSCCDHPLCGFHGDFVIDRDTVIPLLTRSAPASCRTGSAPAGVSGKSASSDCCSHAASAGQSDPPTLSEHRGDSAMSGCCSDPAAADKNREFVARRWLRAELRQGGWGSGSTDIHDMEYFLRKVQENGFTVTSMLFQDAGNVDFSRLRHCSLHVFDRGRFVPFCSYYLSGWTVPEK